MIWRHFIDLGTRHFQQSDRHMASPALAVCELLRVAKLFDCPTFWSCISWVPEDPGSIPNW